MSFFSFLFLFFLFYFEPMHGMWSNIWLLAVSLKLVLRSGSCVGSCVDLGPSALCSGVGPKRIFSSPGVTHVQIRDSWWLPTKNLLLKFYPDAQVSFFSISSPYLLITEVGFLFRIHHLYFLVQSACENTSIHHRTHNFNFQCWFALVVLFISSINFM